MNKPKTKNFILIVLLAVNIIFLLLLIRDSHESSQLRAGMEADISRLFSSYGVALSEDLKLIQEAPASYTLYRDLDEEAFLVRSLLGDCSIEDMGGNILFYSGNRGQSHFRGSGEFELLFFDPGEYTIKNDPKAPCVALLKAMGMKAGNDGITIEKSSGSTTVTVTASYESLPVFNCKMVFTFSQENLLMVQGQRLFDAAVRTDADGLIDSATALMRFAENLESGTVACTSITSLGAGYAVSVTVSGESALTPVWQLDTDTGSYYINAATGRLQST